MSKDDAQQQLITIVKSEVSENDKGQFWVTDKVAFNMREMIKQFRKNYWGVFDHPKDPVTGKERVWVPLTRLLCDAVRKNVDLDPKDVRFRAKHSNAYGTTDLVRGFVRDWLSRIYFNHTLNQAIFTAVVDGTEVWKTYTLDGQIVRKDVDILNVYIDPTADSIQDAYRFTERVLMTESEMKKMDWENTSEFKSQKDLESEDGNAAKKAGKYGDVYECWGMFPEYLIKAANGEEHNEDDDKEIEAHVVISGIDTGNVLYHFSEKNQNKDKNGVAIKPYEEAWYIKVPGRWYGVGIPEIVMQLQTWINIVINLRINKNTVAQLGLLKIRKGSDVTQQMLTNLVSKGVIELNNMDDLDNLPINEAGQSSYEDENTAKTWAQEVTSVFDINLADLPASTSATGAVIQDRQSKSAFTLVTESMEHFIQRWMDKHVLPHVPKMIKDEGFTTIFRDFDDIKRIRERIVANMTLEQLEKSYKETGTFPTEENLLDELRRVERQLEDRGDLFVEELEDIIAQQLDTEVFMTNTEIDVSVTVRNLLELRNGVDPQTAAEMTAEAMDLLGLQVPQSLRTPQQQQPQQPQANSVNTEQIAATEANALNNEQR